MRAACAAMKRITAMNSWVKRKKRGAEVVLRTHLFLYVEKTESSKWARKERQQGENYAITIYMDRD
jgi:hypothetical protein